MATPRSVDPPLLVAVWFLLGVGVSASLLIVSPPSSDVGMMSIAAALVAIGTAVATWRGRVASEPRTRAVFRVSAVAGALIALSLMHRLWLAHGWI